MVRCEAGGVLLRIALRRHRSARQSRLHSRHRAAGRRARRRKEEQSARFGLVREDGKWKLLSLGLVLLDVPSLARQWAQADLEAHESQAVQVLRAISGALNTYVQAYGMLPEMLSQLGPPSVEDHGKSPDKAGLLDADVTSGEYGGYRFRYNIAPQPRGAGDSTEKPNDGFQLSRHARSVDYGKDGQRSFYMDATGKLRGADKHGAVATLDDPEIAVPAQP